MAPSRGSSVPRLATAGEALTAFSGLLLVLCPFFAWYSAPSESGLVLSLTGWHSGTAGKLVLFVGIAVLLLLALRATGLELPESFPTGAAASALGTAGAILVLVRILNVPDQFVGAGRGAGLWISLASGFAVVVSGLYLASEEA